MILFQGVPILSGNLSFLNGLTIIPLLACFHDEFLKKSFPEHLAARLLSTGVCRPYCAGFNFNRFARIIRDRFAVPSEILLEISEDELRVQSNQHPVS